MHRFGPELQKAATAALKELGVEVITGDRMVKEDKERGVVVLRSGREVECDFLVGHPYYPWHLSLPLLYDKGRHLTTDDGLG